MAFQLFDSSNNIVSITSTIQSFINNLQLNNIAVSPTHLPMPSFSNGCHTGDISDPSLSLNIINDKKPITCFFIAVPVGSKIYETAVYEIP